MTAFWKRDRIVFWLIIAIFLTIKFPNMGFRFEDGGIYVYMAKLITEGFTPYVDFLFAHPIGHILFLIPLYKILQNHLVYLFFFVPNILILVSGYFIYKIINRISTPIMSLIGMTLFLFSSMILCNSDSNQGINLVTMLLMISYYFSMEESNKPVVAGIFSGLALIVRFYSAPVVVAITIAYFLKDRKAAIKFAATAGGILLFIMLMGLFIAGGSYLEQVFLYHLYKKNLPKLNITYAYLIMDSLQILLGIAGIWFCIKEKRYKIVLSIGLVLLLYILIKEILQYYMVLIVPYLIFSGVIFINNMKERVSRRTIEIVISILVIVSVVANYLVYELRQSKFNNLKGIELVGEFINKNTESWETIYGASEITPLLALLSDRKIANNYVDTSGKLLDAGIIKWVDRINGLLKSKNKFYILPVTSIPEKEQFQFSEANYPGWFINDHCTIVQTFPMLNSDVGNALYIFTCTEEKKKKEEVKETEDDQK